LLTGVTTTLKQGIRRAITALFIAATTLFYKAHYLPATADALTRLADEISYFNATVAQKMRDLAYDLHKSVAISGFLLAISKYTTQLPVLHWLISGTQIIGLVTSIWTVYQLLAEGLTFDAGPFSLNASVKLGVWRIAWGLIRFDIDPAADVNNAALTLYSLRSGQYPESVEYFRAVWENIGRYISSGSASLSFDAAGISASRGVTHYF
jgi:hypothetical protein